MTLQAGAEAYDESRRRLMLGLLFLPLTTVRTSGAHADPNSPIAHVSELSKPWSAVQFTMADPDGTEIPCIIVRLPDDKWYASSLICTHNKCTVMYVTDLDMACDSFNVETKIPVLACPCHFSVFDPTHGGQVIGGPAPSPLLQLYVEVRGSDVFVSRQ